MEDKDKKLKVLEEALKQIDKQFGRGTVMRLGEKRPVIETGEVIPTGSLALDAALGIGGVPRGRVIEIFGPEACGKTTLALHIVAEAQKRGGIAAYIDAEHALDPQYARNLGVNVDDLFISQPDTGEQALEIAETLTRSGAVDVIVVDSVAALVPRAEIEGEMGDAHIGLQARLMSQALRKLTAAISKSRTCALFLNQVRYKIGVMFGTPTTTPGGLALKFYSTVRMEMKRLDQIKVGDRIIGNKVSVKIVKNKLAPPFKKAEFDIYYGKGISRESELLNLGVEHKIIKKSGAWYAYGDLQLGQGRENAIKFLMEHPELVQELEHKIRSLLGLPEVG
ncbi:recombinase RecA [candidate division WOR-3 bacterium]|nr:recombinase RecA [candidate division WOR-3 bacterium]